MFNFLVGVGVAAAAFYFYPEFVPQVAECTKNALQ